MNRQDLEKLYRQARYVVDEGGDRFTIRLGLPNDELNEFLSTHGVSTWAFITAYNPLSTPTVVTENEVRQRELVRLLQEEGYSFLKGYGTGEDWEPEPSLFVLDIARDAVVSVAAKFRQHAILWGEIGGQPQLVWCDKTE